MPIQPSIQKSERALGQAEDDFDVRKKHQQKRSLNQQHRFDLTAEAIQIFPMKINYLATTLLLLVTTTIALSGVAGILTKEARNWEFIQAVGGMRVSVLEETLLVDCDVSGLKQVTVKPTLVNSGIGVRKLKHKRDGNTIYLNVVTGVLQKGMKTSTKPVDLSDYPAGEYSVQYLDRDGTKHAVGRITVKRKKIGEQDDGGAKRE